MTTDEKKKALDTIRAPIWTAARIVEGVDANGSPVQADLFAEPYSPAPQPPPRPGVSQVIPWLITALESRREFGLRKYGVELATHNGRKAFADAMDEILDFIVYTAQGERELEDLRREIAAREEDLAAYEEDAQTIADLLAPFTEDDDETESECLSRLVNVDVARYRQARTMLEEHFADFETLGGFLGTIDKLIQQRADYDDAGQKHAERAKEIERLTRALKMTEEAGEDIRRKNIAYHELAESLRAERDALRKRLDEAKGETGDASEVLIKRLTQRNEDLSKRVAELETAAMAREDELRYQKKQVEAAHSREARAVEAMGAEVEGLKEKLRKMEFDLDRAQELRSQAERAHASVVGEAMRRIMEERDTSSKGPITITTGALTEEQTKSLVQGAGPIYAMQGLTLRRLVAEAHSNALAKGFYRDIEPSNAEIAQRLALIHSEVSEALEELRVENDATRTEMWRDPDGKPCGFVSELADIVIRVGDLCGWLAIDLEHACDAKMEFNRSRPAKHGKRF